MEARARRWLKHTHKREFGLEVRENDVTKREANVPKVNEYAVILAKEAAEMAALATQLTAHRFWRRARGRRNAR